MRALALSLLASTAAAAWPVDAYVDVEAGAEKFVRPAAIEWAQVEDPKVATAEVMESGELLVTGVAPGRTLVLLYAEGKAAVYRVRVSAKGAKPKPANGDVEFADARERCKDVGTTKRDFVDVLPGASPPERLVRFGASIPDEKCRAALLRLFQTDTFAARDLELVYEVAALQKQLESILDGFEQSSLPLSARYVGAGLVLEGTATRAQHRRALWEVFKRSVGRVPLDDRVEITEPVSPEQHERQKSPPATEKK